MAGDISWGKRVIIHPAGADAFPLPEGHTAKIVEVGSIGECVHLASPNGDGTYKVLGIEHSGDDVVVRTGEAMIQDGPARWMSEGAPEPVGYPFPR